MDPLLIVTQVDLSGVKELATGTQAAMTQVQTSTGATSVKLQEMARDLAQMNSAVRIQVNSLKDAYLEMGDAAAMGNEEAIAKIGDQEAALVETKAAVLALKREMAEVATQIVAATPAATVGASGGGADAVASAGPGAASAQLQLATANEALDKSATAASVSLGRLAQSENVAKTAASQAAALKSVESGYYVTEAQAARVAAMANQTLAEEAMLSGEAWEEAYTGVSTATEGIVAETAAARANASSVFAMAEANAVANKSAGSLGSGGARMAAEGISIMEGRMRAGSFAAANFLTHVLKIGPAIQAAFPIIGAAALLTVFYEIGKAAVHLFENVVMLRAQIEALGEASSKTAKEAASANWEWVQSQAELLKAQGKYAEAQEFLETHASAKPLHLSLGLSKEQMKELSPELQNFARSLEEINTQAGAASKLGQIGGFIDKSKESLKTAQEDLKRYQAELNAVTSAPQTSPTSGLAQAGQITRLEGLSAHAAARISSETELQNALLNLQHTQQSKESAESAKDAARKISEEERVYSQMAAIQKAQLESTRRVREADVALAEETARHQLAVGETTGEQEVAALAAQAKKKVQIEIDYRTGLLALAKQDPNLGKDNSKQAQIITEEGEIAALRKKMRSDDLAESDALSKERLRATLEAIDVQIAATKTETAEESGAARNIAAQVVGLEQQKVQAVIAAGITRGEEYKRVLEGLLAADREYALASKRVQDEAVALQLHDADKAERDRERIQQDAARRKESELGVTAAVKKAAAPTFEAPQQQQNRQIADAQASADAQSAIEQQLLTSKIASLLKQQQAYEAAYLSGEISAQKYKEKATAIDDEITVAAADASAKQTQIVTKAAEQEVAIRDAATRKEEAAIRDFVTSATNDLNNFAVTILTTTGTVNGRISEWKYFQQQFSGLVFQMEKDFLKSILKMVEDTALFNTIQNKIQNALGSVFAHVGLGSAAHGAGGAAGGAQKTAAEAQATIALNAFTAAVHSATVATTGTVAPTTAATAAKTAEVPAVTAGTIAHASNTGAVHTSTLAHIGHATHVALSSIAHIFHSGVTHVDTSAQAVNTAATLAEGTAAGTAAVALAALAIAATANAAAMVTDTIATVVDATVKLATLGFEEGGVIPHTGLHLLHKDERVLSVKQRADYEGMMGATPRSPIGEQDGSGGGGGGASHVSGEPSSPFALHYHAGSVSALDSHGVDSVLRKSQGELVRLVREGVRRGSINPRDLRK